MSYLNRTRTVTLLLLSLVLASCSNSAVPSSTAQSAAPDTSVAADPVSTTESTEGGGVSAENTLTPPAGASTSLSTLAYVDCTSWTYKGTAQAACTIRSGQARVRADCVFAPDLYSPWTGKGTWSMWTGSCPWGIRGAIIETRN